MPAAVAASSRCMTGSAMLTMLLSSVDMNVMATTVKSTTHLFGCGRDGATGPS